MEKLTMYLIIVVAALLITIVWTIKVQTSWVFNYLARDDFGNSSPKKAAWTITGVIIVIVYLLII